MLAVRAVESLLRSGLAPDDSFVFLALARQTIAFR